MKYKYFLLCLALGAVVACHPFRTDLYTDEVALPLQEGSADSLLVSISLEYVRGSGEAAQAMNTALLARAFDLEDGDGTVEETPARYRDNLIDEYLTENGGRMGSVLSWEDRVSGSFGTTYKGWRNYFISYYAYRGGAHGMETLVPVVFDARTGAVVGEQDLFADGYAAPVAALIARHLQALLAEDEATLLTDGEAPRPNGCFSVGADGVQWFFQPYEIGPYSLGILTVTVPWGELAPYLR